MTGTDIDSTTAALSGAGVSIWLDDLSRELLSSGALESLIADKNVVGITTNPTIFATALSRGNAYDAQIRELADAGADVEEALFQLTTADVSHAADVLRPIYDSTEGFDGRVSIEVSPDNAYDTDATISEAHKLWDHVNRPNVMIKIPATTEGLPAITAAIAAGISVNVTLIFSLTRYAEVIDAYLAGLEQAAAAGVDVSTIHSVASFFVSRVDLLINEQLAQTGSEEAAALRNRAGIANARLAYELYTDRFGDKFADLRALGANPQRPLWASTGVKDPSLPDTFYVTELVTDGVVNTMPAATLDAVADHGILHGDRIQGTYDAARADLARLTAHGVSYDEVTTQLADDGVAKFVASWADLKATVDAALTQSVTQTV
ncbi:MAG: transaldolase [Microbacterium sp.]